MIGVLTVRWLRYIFEQSPEKRVHDSVLKLVGLTLPYGLYDLSGRALELCSELYEQGTVEIKPIIIECMGITERISTCLTHRHSRDDLAQLLRLGYDIEFFLLCASVLLKAGPTANGIPFPLSAVTVNLKRCIELDDDLLQELETFFTHGVQSLQHGPQVIRSVLQSGELLVDRAYHCLKR